MEVWRPEVLEGRRPDVISGRNILVALALHLLAFSVFWIFAVLHGLLKPKETVIPIDLTIVVNQNLDGNEEDPPPLANPEPPPPPPQPKPKPKPDEKKPDPPKALEQIVTNVVKKVDEKDEKPKVVEPPKDEPPKKTAKELREERIRRMREMAVKNTKPVKIEVKGPSGNGRTAKQTMSEAEIRKLLDMGYRPGKENNLAASELQLGVSLVQMALNEKWDSLGPKVGASGDVLLSCRFNSSGGLVNVRIVQSCGDKMSDSAALSVARAVTHIRNLPAGFLNQFSKETLTIRYHVRGM